MKVNFRKLLQLILFFAHHDVVKPLGKTKLYKLLYFTDATHVQRFGESITGAEYLKYPYGPVPKQGDFALKTLQQHKQLRQKRVQSTPTYVRREMTALQKPNMTLFTEQEMHTIHSVLQRYGEDTASVLSWKSHHEWAWLLASDRGPLQLIPVQPLAEHEGKNAAAIALLDEWYATPDDRPPGYWDELMKEIETNRLRFREEDIES